MKYSKKKKKTKPVFEKIKLNYTKPFQMGDNTLFSLSEKFKVLIE